MSGSGRPASTSSIRRRVSIGEVDQPHEAGKLDEHLVVGGDPDVVDDKHVGLRGHVDLDPRMLAPLFLLRDTDVLVGQGRQGTSWIRPAEAWLAKASLVKKQRAASARCRGDTGVVASTYTPRKIRRNVDPRSSLGAIPASIASARVKGRRVLTVFFGPGFFGPGAFRAGSFVAGAGPVPGSGALGMPAGCRFLAPDVGRHPQGPEAPPVRALCKRRTRVQFMTAPSRLEWS